MKILDKYDLTWMEIRTKNISNNVNERIIKSEIDQVLYWEEKIIPQHWFKIIADRLDHKAFIINVPVLMDLK